MVVGKDATTTSKSRLDTQNMDIDIDHEDDVV
jgi:hypothetical protein